MALETEALLTEAIHHIAHNRRADKRHVDTNLMGTPGHQIDFYQRLIAAEITFDYMIFGDGWFAAAHDCHTLALIRVTGNRGFDAANLGRWHFFQQGEIGF